MKARSRKALQDPKRNGILIGSVIFGLTSTCSVQAAVTRSTPQVVLEMNEESEAGSVLSSFQIKAGLPNVANLEYQSIESLIIDGDQVKLIHLLSGVSESKLEYQIRNQSGKVLKEVEPVTTYATGIFKSELVLKKEWIEAEPFIYLTYTLGDDDSTSYIVQDFDQSISQVSQSEASFLNYAFQSQQLVLLNEETPHYHYESHQFFGESLHLTLKSSDLLKTYQLIDEVGNVQQFDYDSSGNLGIRLSDLVAGRYYVQLNENYVYTQDSVFEIWYTVHREGMSKQIKLESYAGVLTLEVSDVENVPDDIYDILVDAGHGGSDSGAVGNGTTEAEEVLKVSQYIAKRLEDHGLRVKMSRQDMSDPSSDERCQYQTCPYSENGRVEQVYQYRVNYVISNHLNASNGAARGFEVYSSMVTDNQWASQIATEFLALGQQAHDTKQSPYRISEGSYKRSYVCDPWDGCVQAEADYYYMMRETGGAITQPTKLIKYSEFYDAFPTYGAETVLVEYAYLDNRADYQYWLKNWQYQGEAVVKATVDYLGIPYQSLVLVKQEE